MANFAYKNLHKDTLLYRLLLDYLLIPGRSLKLPEKKPPITVVNMVATFLSRSVMSKFFMNTFL